MFNILVSYTLLGAVQPQYQEIARVLGVSIYWARRRRYRHIDLALDLLTRTPYCSVKLRAEPFQR